MDFSYTIAEKSKTDLEMFNDDDDEYFYVYQGYGS